MKRKCLLSLFAASAAVWTLLGTFAAAGAPIGFDAVNGHEWIGEPYGSPITTSVVDFRGHRCLKGEVTLATANYAFMRTERFPLEAWRPTYRLARSMYS